MCTFSYWLHFAAVIVFIAIAARVSAASGLFKKKDPKWKKDERIQFKINAQLKRGFIFGHSEWRKLKKSSNFTQLIYVPLGEKWEDEDKKSWPFVKKGTKFFSIISPLRKNAPLKVEKWERLPLLLPDPKEPDENIVDLCRRKQSLLISPDLIRLRRLNDMQLGQENLYFEKLKKSRRCVIAVGGNNFLFSPFR